MTSDPYTIQARSSCYRPMKGGAPVLFRSVLEARWAYAFDALHLAWEYEPQTFTLPGGRRYTPDFLVGGVGWIEIKPDYEMLEAVATKLRGLALLLERAPGVYGGPAEVYSIDVGAPALTNGSRGAVIRWHPDGYTVFGKTTARHLFTAEDSRLFAQDHPDWFADHVDRVLRHAGEVKIDSAWLASGLAVAEGAAEEEQEAKA